MNDLQKNILNNPFQLFNIAANYCIDEKFVNNKYLNLQKQFHPDNFANHTAKEKLMATKISADIVSAYKILLDPIKRAEALLNIDGFDFDLTTYVSNDKDMLLEQIALREQLDNANNTEFSILKKRWLSEFNTLERKFMQYLDKKELENAAKILLKMRYYQKLLQELKYKQIK